MEDQDSEVADLIPMLRWIVGARVGHHPAAEDLVQETLVRVLAARDRIEPGMVEPCAIATVRNLMATRWRQEDRERRNRQGAHDPGEPERGEDVVIASEETAAIARAVQCLDDRERRVLLAHEVGGEPTRSLAEESGSTAGAVAAQLKRTRARLCVEYLIALENVEPPTDQCRPVLLALSRPRTARTVASRVMRSGSRRHQGSVREPVQHGTPQSQSESQSQLQSPGRSPQ